MKEKILELCVDIYAHDQLDWEITLCGNGCNAFECSGVANEMLEIMGIEKSAIDGKILAKVREYKPDWEPW